MPATVTSRGQVTIPKPIRERLGIKAGNAVDFQLAADGRVTLVKVSATEDTPNRFQSLRGRAGPGMSTDDVMTLTRGER